jgi:hypothetical protein
VTITNGAKTTNPPENKPMMYGSRCFIVFERSPVANPIKNAMQKPIAPDSMFKMEDTFLIQIANGIMLDKKPITNANIVIEMLLVDAT